MIRPSLALALVALCAHAETPSDYAAGVTVVTRSGSAFYQLALPTAVYEGVVDAGLADVRMFNAGGDVVPFAWMPRPASVPEPKPGVALPLFPLHVDRRRGDVAGLTLNVVRTGPSMSIDVAARDGESPGDRVLGGYVLDATGIDEPLTALVFSLPASGTPTLHLRVDASDDLAEWRPVVSDATLVNLEYGGRRLTRDRIEFRPTKARYFRLSWSVDRPAMEFIAVQGEVGERSREPPHLWREVAGTAVADTAGDFVFDLGGPLPIDRITMILADVNSVVPAELFVRTTPKEPWRSVGPMVFYRLQQPGGDVTNAPIAVASTAARYWLLRVDPRSGGVGREPPRASFGWQPQALVFAARGGGPFVLAYGKRSAAPGALSIATLVPGYDPAKGLPDNVAVAEAGEPLPLGGTERLREPIDTRRWVLWVSLTLGVIVLGFMAWRLSREMRAAEAVSAAERTETEKREPE